MVVRDFDPEGTDGQENTDQVPNAIDGVPATAWTTSRYKTATFGGLKTGVGLLLDLGKPTDLHTVQVGFTAAGAKVELRVSDTAPTARRRDLTTVAAGRDGNEIATLRPPPGPRRATSHLDHVAAQGRRRVPRRHLRAAPHLIRPLRG